MNKQVEELLNTLSGQHYVDSFEGDVIEDEWKFYHRFNQAVASAREDADLVALASEWISSGTTHRELDEWLQVWQEYGYSTVWGSRVLDLDAAENALVYRLAERWESGLSWAADARSCVSAARGPGAGAGLTLWAAVVPAEAVLARVWAKGAGVFGGRPLLRTINHETMGTVQLAVDDSSEMLVDPVKLEEGAVLAPGLVVALRHF